MRTITIPKSKLVCRSCEWWNKESVNDDVGICQSSMVRQPSYGKRDNREMVPSGVLTCDEGGLTGELVTGPDFGCVHWKGEAEKVISLFKVVALETLHSLKPEAIVAAESASMAVFCMTNGSGSPWFSVATCDLIGMIQISSSELNGRFFSNAGGYILA